MRAASLDDPAAVALLEMARTRGPPAFCGCDPKRCQHRFPERPNLEEMAHRWVEAAYRIEVEATDDPATMLVTASMS